MKKFSPAFVLLIVSFLVLLSCKKINEPTSLGGDLIPGVDNVTTFELLLDAQTANHVFNDSTKVGYSDQVAAGHLNDPEFGQTHANFQFNISPTVVKRNPLREGDSLRIDSVVLSLAFTGSYGDTNSIQTIRVFEIDPSSGFRADTLYKYADAVSEFPTVGSQLGSATFAVKNLDDSMPVVRPGDTGKVANVIRIKFIDTSLGFRFRQYDTTFATNGGFYSDSLFRTLFKGLAIKADNSGNTLAYFSLSDGSKTKLQVYYHSINNGDTTYSSVDFTHSRNGQTNFIQRQHSANVTSGGGDKLYIQSAPGSYASVVIPGLSTMTNKVVHRAELIATKIPSNSENIFTVPPRLLLDRINNQNGDSSYLFEKDLVLGADGSVGYDLFGGTLTAGNVYRFNITRYVQGILTRGQRNDILRLWAPFRAYEFDITRPDDKNPNGSYLLLPVNNRMGEGRVVVGGGNYADPKARLRLRIVYSNL